MPAYLQSMVVRSRMVWDEAHVGAAIERLAESITARLSGRDVVVLVVLNGGVVFAGQLLPRLSIAMRLDYVHATRYDDGLTGSELRWIHDVPNTVLGKTVLVLDDIHDQGVTLEAIVDRCRQNGASEVVTAVLVQKRHKRSRVGLQPDFVGLECEDLYVYGYGMDLHGYGRNFPAIYGVEPGQED